MNFETAAEIEIAIAGWFGIRKHVIVPNVSWGLFNHECDVTVLSSSNYAYEIEIKVSKSDLVRDKAKWHNHDSIKIRKLWFAVPEKLNGCIEYIPARAGILVVSKKGVVSELRAPEVNAMARKLSEKECFTLARLGTMRIWSLKEALIRTQIELWSLKDHNN